MKRLLLVSSDNPRDKRVWSGTKYSIYCQLKQYYDVTILNLDPIVWARRIDKLCMLALTMGKQHTPFGLMVSYCNSKKVERELRNGKYDVAFVFDCTSIPFLRTKTPVVYFTDTTTHLMQHYYWDFRWPLDWVADVIQKKCMEKSDVVITSSTWAINDMTSFFSIPPNKCKLCRFGANGIVEDREIVCNEETINLVFVGVDWKRKGGDIALDALRILKKTDTTHQYRLHVVGSRPSEEVKEEDVTFYGFLDRNDPEQEKLHTKVFKEGDIFILPTRAECSAIVNCEASGYGMPIVIYDTGGVGDYVINGVNGFRLPMEAGGKEFAEKIHQIVADPELRLQLSNGGKKLYAEHLNWDVAGKTMKKTIDSLCSESTSS